MSLSARPVAGSAASRAASGAWLTLVASRGGQSVSLLVARACSAPLSASSRLQRLQGLWACTSPPMCLRGTARRLPHRHDGARPGVCGAPDGRRRAGVAPRRAAAGPHARGRPRRLVSAQPRRAAPTPACAYAYLLPPVAAAATLAARRSRAAPGRKPPATRRPQHALPNTQARRRAGARRCSWPPPGEAALAASHPRNNRHSPSTHNQARRRAGARRRSQPPPGGGDARDVRRRVRRRHRGQGDGHNGVWPPVPRHHRGHRRAGTGGGAGGSNDVCLPCAAANPGRAGTGAQALVGGAR